MRRLLALVAAIAMVVLATVIRAQLDDDGGSGSNDGDDGDRFRIACASELEVACEQLEDDADVDIDVQRAGETADAVAAGEPTFDAWLVPQPWPAMANIGRELAGFPRLFDDVGPVLARSPLLAVAVKDKNEVATCTADSPSWRCVGDSAESGARVIWADPVRSALGALNLGAVTVGFLSDIAIEDIALIDFTDDYRVWFNELLRSARPSDEPVLTLLRSSALADLAVATEAEWRVETANAAPGPLEPLQFLYPEPVVTADVVLAPVEGRTVPRDLAEAATQALSDAGWRIGRYAPREGEPALPSSTNLPNAGVLVALREEAK